MKIKDFDLERYFARHEFTSKYLLSSSDCDGFSLKHILDIASTNDIAIWNELNLGYTESEGSSLLREAIIKNYKNVSTNNVLVASPGELNFILMNVILETKDHVISISPAYQSLYEVVNSIGCEISYWQPNPDNWKFNTEDLKKLIRKNTKLIIINFPHNPTGSYIEYPELNEIVDIARGNNIYIFSDEMYSKLMISNMDELPPVSDLYEKGISLWGTSKSFGLAGLRTGWIVTQDTELLKKILAFKDYLSICNSAPAEILTLIALNNIDKFINPNIKKIKRNIKLFNEFVSLHPGLFNFTPPKAGSTAFVKINIKGSTLDFSNKLVEKAGIMTVPAEMFNFNGNFIRIGFGRENLPETLNAFEDFLNENIQSFNLN
ncbi:MAG TPA: aminotransferase class I/II-fold pyridoxal phosphate-dependent enzyme [Ignavibacteriaceae bacterium]|nr:aminotransferase class I/II-fold pyridoxal phosphate-dependent enzyme [Ignavibacteriaceae bacterium]